MDLFLQRVFDGFFNGGIYAALAVAFALTVRTTGLVNFAQGEMATFSAFVCLLLLGGQHLTGEGLVETFVPGIPWPMAFAMAGAIVFGMAMGAVTEAIMLRRLDHRSELSRINFTIGLLILMNGLMVELWGTGSRAFPSPFPSGPEDYVDVGGARLRYQTIGVWLTLSVALAVLALLMDRTKLGLAFRAVTVNRDSAVLCGISARQVLVIGWALAAGLGALSATMVANSVLLRPDMMIRVFIFALAAATIGGLDSPIGAVIGGAVVGLSQSLAPAYIPGIDSEVSMLPAVAVMVIVLVVRPQGLFGRTSVGRL